MKIITKYKAQDGSEFNSENECLAHEDLIGDIETIMSNLPKMDNSCDFQNGSGYYRLKKDVFIKVKNALLELAKNYTDHRWIQESIDKGMEVHSSWAGRIISECCPDPLYKAWYIISCTTSKYKCYGQPYYANKPNEAIDICLNKD